MSKLNKMRIALYILLAISLILSLFTTWGKITIDFGDIIYNDMPNNDFWGGKQTARMELDITRKILTAGAILCELVLAKHHMASSSTLATTLCGFRCIPLSLLLMLAWLIPNKVIHFAPNVWGILWLMCNISSFVLHILVRRQKKTMASLQPPSVPTAEGEWVYVPK